jgi:hypothetical protein
MAPLMGLGPLRRNGLFVDPTPWPLVCDLVMMRSFHNVFMEALQYGAGIVTLDDAEELSEISETELLLPSTISGAYRKEENRRNKKALRWLQDPRSLFCLMVFLHVAVNVMELHWSLFKYAQSAPYGRNKSYIFKLCDPRQSRPVEIMAKLAKLLLKPDEWRVMTTRFGPYVSWPSEYKQVTRECVVMLYCQVWRRLVHVFEQSPWWLVPLADPDVAEDRKRELADRLFAEPDASLDASALKIRLKAGSASSLLLPFWQSFLFHAFNLVVVSTAYVECLFASYRQWIIGIPKPMSVVVLQAKHITSSFKRSHVDMMDRSRDHAIEAKRCKLSRPPWIVKIGEGGRQTSRHAFFAEKISARSEADTVKDVFKSASVEWNDVDAPRRRKYKGIAKTANAWTKKNKIMALASKNATDFHEPSPWNAARGQSGYPLDPDIVKNAIHARNGVKSGAASFSQCGYRILESEEFPSSVKHAVILTPYMVALDEDKRANANSIILALSVILTKRGTKCKHMIPIAITDQSSHRTVIVQCASRKKISPFNAEFLYFTPSDADCLWWDALPDAPFRLEDRGVLDMYPISDPLLRCYDESKLACEIANTSVGPWSYRMLQVEYDASDSMKCFDIVAVGEYLDIEAERIKTHDLAAALRAFRLFKTSQRPWQDARRSSRAKSARHHADANKAAGVPKIVDIFAKDKILDSNDEDESSAESDGRTTLAFKRYREATDRSTMRERIGKPLIPREATDEENASEEDMPPDLDPPVPVDPPVPGDPPVPADDPPVPADDPAPVDPPRRNIHIHDDDEPLSVLSRPPMPVPMPAAVAAPMPAAAPHQRLDEYLIENIGMIKIDRKRGLLNAHCFCLGPPRHAKDHRTAKTPECRLNRNATKAPLGLHIAWLRIGHCFDSRKEHLDSLGIITRDEREEARQWLQSQSGRLADLLVFEAECLRVPVDSVLEPVVIT